MAEDIFSSVNSRICGSFGGADNVLKEFEELSEKKTEMAEDAIKIVMPMTMAILVILWSDINW